ncbi:MAG: response regulator [Desulfobacteraceae bacterium]|nr:response regulator [Desulfobacteraceae bacterium]
MSKILVVDDEEANVRLLAMSLRSDGHEVLTALSGEQGLETFKKDNPDLVITDIKMPGMDGIEVLKQIKQLDSNTEVIIITGHGDIDNAIEALKFGASDFINKPIRDEVLTVSIKRAEEKIYIKRQLQEHTDNLERRVQQATREITRQSNFLSKLIRSSHEGIIATGQDLKIVIYNPGAQRIFGYLHDEVLNQRKITELLEPELLSFLEQKKPSSGNEQNRKEACVYDKNRELIPVRFYGTPLFEKKEKIGTVCFFQDLREIKRLESELVQNERLAAIGQTVAGVAHGVKNILHGFKGGSYLLNLGLEKNEKGKLRQGWDMIQRNIQRTSELVLDLLSFSKERDPQKQSCQPNTIVVDVCEVMKDLAAKNRIELTTDLDPAIGFTIVDPHSLHQCLANLISNAIDACLFDENVSKKWCVHVKTERVDEQIIRFSVSDTGMGMSPEVKKKLFSSFFSTKGHRGTGLGLLVTRKLIKEHDGSITVDSEQKKGTTFTIELPFCEQVQSADSQSESEDL